MIEARTRRAGRLGVFAMLLVLVAGACGGDGEEPLEIGVERSALDLVFKEETERAESKQEPSAPPTENGSPPPSPAQTPVPQAGPAPPAPPPVGPVETCPEAGPDAFPEEPASTMVTKPPQEGIYGYHNQGTFEIEGSVPLKGPYPPETTREIELLEHPATEEMRFKVTHRGVGDAVVERTYRVTAADGGDAALQLVKLHERSEDDEMTFEPTPPVTIMGLGQGEGDSWNSAGMDPETGMSMAVQGEIEKRELVDVCGNVYDTYRVVSDETMVNVSTGFRRETEEPTIYNVATQLGALFLRIEVHNTTTTQEESGPTTVHLDYVSVADSAEPRATS